MATPPPPPPTPPPASPPPSIPPSRPIPPPPPEAPQTDARQPGDTPPGAAPQEPGPSRRPSEGGLKALLGTLLFIMVAIGVVFTIGAGGIGVLLMVFLAASWPLAAPGILLYVVAVCLPAGLVIWAAHRARKESRPLRLPGPFPIAAGAAAAIVLGQIAQYGRITPLILLCFWLAAALPPLVSVALASGRLAGATTWRRALFGLVTGSLFSTTLTLLLGGVVTLAAYAVVLPLRQIVAHVLATPGAERLFFSPALAVAMIGAAVVAPVVEELTKPLAAFILGRQLRSPAEAFLVGMAGGAGFAIVENMLYESGGFTLWAAVATLRGVGGVLHPLNAGLVALGWYGVVRGTGPGRWRRLLALYGLAVGIHALWNGGLTLIFSAAGAYFFATDTWEISVYGLGQPGIVLVFMALEAIALWRLLLLVTNRLRGGAATVTGSLGLRLDEPRRLAAWGVGVVLVVVPIGLLYGPLLARYADRMIPIH